MDKATNKVKPLTCQELDTMGCGDPDCINPDHNILYLSPGCHPEAHLQVCYVKDKHVIVILCDECDGTVANIAVAPRGTLQ